MPAHEVPDTDPIDASVLVARTGLATFEHLATTASTMERARALAADAACPLPAAVVADRQSAGRGRRGAGWWQAASSLAVSVVVDGDVTRQAPPVWSLACGVALAEAVAAAVPGVEPQLRWPNDLEVDGRKLAGILVETIAGRRAIFGVGINTAGSSRHAPEALRERIVTLPDLTGSVVPRQHLLEAFLPRLFAILSASGGDSEAFVARYHARCGLTGQTVTVYGGQERITGVCRGIAGDGSLVLDTVSGRRLVVAGSLTAPADVWRRP